MAPSVRPLYQAVADAIGRQLGATVDLTARSDYTDLGAGRDDLAFVCGLPYVEVVDGLICAPTPLAAPVLSGARYGGRPVYFSDVIVPASSPARGFDDLRGGRWAYNERGSHSGYLITLHRLATAGEDSGFFREWVDAGFHGRAIEMVAAGEVDGAAIDSQVLAVALDREPGLAHQVRVVESLGPSTIPPLVAAERLPDSTHQAVRDAVVRLGSETGEREVMAAMHVERFVPIDDTAYDDIRAMLARVEMAGLWTAPRPAGLRPAID
jgi:phosphonate transport system substrate-binding protein